MALCVMACILPYMSLRGQQADCVHTLYLHIVDEQTLQPVVGAVVQLNKVNSQSDPDGYAVFPRVCQGLFHVHVQATGYQSTGQELRYDYTDSIRIVLQPLRNTLDAIEISSHRQSVQSANAVSSLQGEELDKLKGKNLAGMLSNIAGVQMLQTGATIGKPVVNGMHSNRLLILNNGIRQEGQQWGSEHAPEIDPFIAQSISVIKGAEAIRYGAEAMGGVIIIEPPALPKDSALHAEVDLATASNGRSGTVAGMLSGNLKRIPTLSWRVQGSGKQGGNFNSAHYYLDNTGVKELNYSAALGYSGKHLQFDLFYSRFNTELGIFKGSHIGSKEDLLAAINRGAPATEGSFYYGIDAPRQHIDHHLLKARGHIHLTDYLHINLQYGFQKNRRQEYDLRRGGRTSIPSMDFDLLTHTADATLEYFDGSRWKGMVGVNGTMQQNSSAANLYTSPLIPDYNSSGTGVYAIGKWLQRTFELEAGVRYDYKYLTALGYRGPVLYGGQRSFHNVSGSLGLVYHINNQTEFKSNIGTAWRPPTVNELYSTGLHHGAAAVEYGDSSLQSEKSIQWMNTVHYANTAQWLILDADIYAHYFNGYIYLMPTGTFSESLRGAFPVFQAESTNALFAGADLSAQLRFSKHFTYQVKAAIVRAKDVQHDRYLPMIPADKWEHSLTARYDLLPFLQESYLQLTHVYVARQSRYEPNSDFAAPPPAYQLININLGTQLHFGKQNLSVHFSIENLTNVSYKDYMNRYRYYAHDIGRNYVLRLSYRI